jgi:hypothetical protein
MIKQLRLLFKLLIQGFILSHFDAIAQSTSAAETFQIVRPLEMDTVASGQLVIIVKLPANHQNNYTGFKVVLNDELDFSELIKIKGDFLTVLHDEPIKPGLHQIKILARKKGANEFNVVKTHAFRVIGAIKENRWLRKKTEIQTGKKESPVKLSGHVYALSNDVFLKGEGAALRQEPAFTREAGVNLNLKINKIEIPVNAMITTNARGEFKFRNRYMAGVKRGRFSATTGDHFVDEDRLVFTGLRIKGLMVKVPTNNQTLITGMVGHNVDELFVDNNFPLLPNQANALFEGGLPRYKRNYLYVKVASSYNKDLTKSHFSILKSYDVFGEDLIGGLRPKDNIVAGFDNYYSMWKQRSILRINLALSLLTNDRSLPTESETYRKVFNINSSTTPLTLDRLSNLAIWLSYQARIAKNHTLTLDGRRLGGSFHSLGNPYILNNRTILRAGERSMIYKNRIFLNLSYDYLIDNNDKTSSITRENHSVSSSLSLNISPKWPSVSFGYRNFINATYGLPNGQTGKFNSTNWFGNINYRVNLGSFTPTISFSRNDMNTISEMAGNNQQLVTDLSLGLIYKNRFGVDAQGMQIKQEFNNQKVPQEMMSLRSWFMLKKPNLRFSVRYLENTMEYALLGKERRRMWQGGIDYYPIKNIIININGGSSPFTGYDTTRNYSERFIQVRLNYFI